jgi:uncharacterized membrane protein YhaH (DUF805 family)
MSIGQWYVSRGRIPRRVYWLHYFLPLTVAAMVAAGLDALFGTYMVDSAASGGPGGGILFTLVLLASLVPSISSEVTRLHDRGHSAWWLLWGLLPVVGGIVLLVQTGFLRGDAGPNQYGPAPDRPAQEPVGV